MKHDIAPWEDPDEGRELPTQDPLRSCRRGEELIAEILSECGLLRCADCGQRHQIKTDSKGLFLRTGGCVGK